MPVFEITAPDGTVYEVEGPDETGALNALKQSLAASPPAATTPPPASPPQQPGEEATGPMQAADDMARIFADAVSLGGANHLAAWGNDTDVEAERALSAEARDRAGWAGTAAEVMGYAVPGIGIQKGLVAAAPKVFGGAGWLPALLGGGVEGLSMGGIQAGLNGESIAEGMGTGLAGGVAGGAIGKKAGDALNWVGRRFGIGGIADDVVPRSTVDELRAAKDDAYEAVRQGNFDYWPSDAGILSQNMHQSTWRRGIDPDYHPRATKSLRKVREIANGTTPMSLADLDDMRQWIKRDVSGDTGEREMAGAMRQEIDKFVNTTPVIGETVPDLSSSTIRRAREGNRRLRATEDLNKALERGANAASPNGDVNALRTLANDEGFMAGLTPDERSTMKAAVRGERMEEAMETVASKLSGMGGHFGIGAIGYMAGGLPGAAAAVVAAKGAESGLKAGARRYRKANIDKLLDQLGGGSVTPSAVRGPATGGGAGVGAGFLTGNAIDEARERRKRKRD